MKNENAVKNGANAPRDEDGNPIFRTEWLNKGYKIIKEPNLYKNLEVVGEPQLYNPADYGQEGNPRYIVNVKAVLQTNLPQLAELSKTEHIRYEDLKGIFMNGTIWVNSESGEVPALPHRKSFVDARVGFVEGQNGEEVLRITDIFVKEAVEAETLDFSVLEMMIEGKEAEVAEK